MSTAQLAHIRAIALPQPIGESIGASSLESIKIQIGATVARTLLAATLATKTISRSAIASHFLPRCRPRFALLH
ncbi:MAG TPA: hypothetical protein VK778_05720 [Solirubrobacteraceae bacterium]|nr:hypothetical protein [Solirubrobacteraceae bacterium]